jgi:hypothetical protein
VANEHEAGMKETNVEYRPLHTRIASIATGFEMRSKCPYSPECVEGGFLRSSQAQSSEKLSMLFPLKR